MKYVSTPSQEAPSSEQGEQSLKIHSNTLELATGPSTLLISLKKDCDNNEIQLKLQVLFPNYTH